MLPEAIQHTLTVNRDITLKRVRFGDAPSLFELIDQYRDSLRTWLPFVDFIRSLDDMETMIGNLNQPFSRQIVFTVRFHDHVAGLIGLKDIDHHNRKLEIGYWIAPIFVGQGIVTQSLEVLISVIFERMEMNRIQIKCAVGNTRSSNIPRRLNFTFEGIEREGEWLNDRYVDLEVYSLLKSEWKHNLA